MTTLEPDEYPDWDDVERMYHVADDHEAATLDDLRRRAGITWEHVGCWTNVIDVSPDGCERCGRSRADIEREEVNQ